MNGQIKELTETEIRLAFASLCVECAARRMGCTPREMYQRMKRVGLIKNYILRHYGVIHTESRQNVTEDIVGCLKDWEERQSISPQRKGSANAEKGDTPC